MCIYMCDTFCISCFTLEMAGQLRVMSSSFLYILILRYGYHRTEQMLLLKTEHLKWNRVLITGCFQTLQGFKTFFFFSISEYQ